MFNEMETIIESTGALIYVIDLSNYKIIYANKKSKEEFGEIIGKTCYEVLEKDLKSPCPFCPLQQQKINLIDIPIGTTYEWENKNSINHKHYLFTDKIIEWSDGRKVKVQIGIDITKQKELEKEISQLAYYDSLTGIPNRLLLRELLIQMIKEIKRLNSYGALLFIDLDYFKIINDTKGHNIGDIVLIETTKRIKSILRENDIVARLGGDEFIVAMKFPNNDENLVVNYINEISTKLLKEIRKPYLIHDFDFRLSASVGIVLFRNDSYSIDELMKFADTAMYNSKEKGKDRFSYFNPKLQQIIEQKADLTQKLRNAIENKEMIIHYQPQISYENNQNKIVSVEALVRWKDAKKGLLFPEKFISLADETNLIVPLGELVFEEVLMQLKQWQNDPIKKDWKISINISYKQFQEKSFYNFLKSQIEKYEIEPNKIKLELTENLSIKNTQEILDKIKQLNNLGINLSIDDFGTGYSSLAYLKQLSINELKIDKSFIKDLPNNLNDSIIVETILSIGNKFNLNVVAEGVETQEQYEKLLSMGCKHFQGFLFKKPVNANLL
ncbi:EAL domain-containing protein [Arcobacter lacus]|uniref:sensor domain-containing protein n=1 Tax=Arcobacter lacus TaxID=1912876 RepID=UPI0021BA44A4|nr:EAL domain-containing protein [Arcobacter lacus]MCT7912134.1 EAL domain-containing protein [Arcobacter lacus]